MDAWENNASVGFFGCGFETVVFKFLFFILFCLLPWSSYKEKGKDLCIQRQCFFFAINMSGIARQ